MSLDPKGVFMVLGRNRERRGREGGRERGGERRGRGGGRRERRDEGGGPGGADTPTHEVTETAIPSESRMET